MDNGRTWSAPITVAQRSGDELFLPEVAVADDGRIAVVWYEAQEAAAQRRFDVEVWYAVSSDQGKRWSDMDLDGPFDMSTAPKSSLGPFLGDYEGMVGLPEWLRLRIFEGSTGDRGPRPLGNILRPQVMGIVGFDPHTGWSVNIRRFGAGQGPHKCTLAAQAHQL